MAQWFPPHNHISYVPLSLTNHFKLHIGKTTSATLTSFDVMFKQIKLIKKEQTCFLNILFSIGKLNVFEDWSLFTDGFL